MRDMSFTAVIGLFDPMGGLVNQRSALNLDSLILTLIVFHRTFQLPFSCGIQTGEALCGPRIFETLTPMMIIMTPII